MNENMMIPISKIGPVQLRDVENSTGLVYHDEYYRLCEVVKSDKAFDNRGDCSPYRMASLFGGDWRDYNYHFIVQVAGCPLSCPYCYVDNFKIDLQISIAALVNDFVEFREMIRSLYSIDVRVFHLMGGAPAVYAECWPEIRHALDALGQEDVILFSDVVFVENRYFGKQPWDYLGLDMFVLTGCLKGVNDKNFYLNTGRDMFDTALAEMSNYVDADNFYLCLIGNDKDCSGIAGLIDVDKIDYLTIVDYQVTKLGKNNAKPY